MRSVLLVLATCSMAAGGIIGSASAADMQQGTKMHQADKVKGCTAQADAKKLSGAARTSFLKKCEG